MSVDRCVCHSVALRAMVPMIGALRAQGTTDEVAILRALADATGCTTGCGMCEPYVKLMLKTGNTSFPVLPPHEIERILNTLTR